MPPLPRFSLVHVGFLRVSRAPCIVSYLPEVFLKSHHIVVLVHPLLKFVGVCADALLLDTTIPNVVHLIIIGRAINTQTLNEELIDAADLRWIILTPRKVELFNSIILQPLLFQFFDKSRLSNLPQSLVVLCLEGFHEVLDVR